MPADPLKRSCGAPPALSSTDTTAQCRIAAVWLEAKDHSPACSQIVLPIVGAVVKGGHHVIDISGSEPDATFQADVKASAAYDGKCAASIGDAGTVAVSQRSGGVRRANHRLNEWIEPRMAQRLTIAHAGGVCAQRKRIVAAGDAAGMRDADVPDLGETPAKWDADACASAVQAEAGAAIGGSVTAHVLVACRQLDARLVVIAGLSRNTALRRGPCAGEAERCESAAQDGGEADADGHDLPLLDDWSMFHTGDCGFV